jgi:hypothetical protein
LAWTAWVIGTGNRRRSSLLAAAGHLDAKRLSALNGRVGVDAAAVAQAVDPVLGRHRDRDDVAGDIVLGSRLLGRRGGRGKTAGRCEKSRFDQCLHRTPPR